MQMLHFLLFAVFLDLTLKNYIFLILRSIVNEFSGKSEFCQI